MSGMNYYQSDLIPKQTGSARMTIVVGLLVIVLAGLLFVMARLVIPPNTTATKKKSKPSRTTGQSSLQVKTNSGSLQGGTAGPQTGLSPSLNNYQTQ